MLAADILLIESSVGTFKMSVVLGRFVYEVICPVWWICSSLYHCHKPKGPRKHKFGQNGTGQDPGRKKGNKEVGGC